MFEPIQVPRSPSQVRRPSLASAVDGTAGFRLRDPLPGDLGWVVHRQALLFNREFGWDRTFEALIAEIVARYVGEFRPGTDRCWIAERAASRSARSSSWGNRRGSSVARLLCVEPSARGLGSAVPRRSGARSRPRARLRPGHAVDGPACYGRRARSTRPQASRCPAPLRCIASAVISRAGLEVILRESVRSAGPALQGRQDRGIEPGRAGPAESGATLTRPTHAECRPTG